MAATPGQVSPLGGRIYGTLRVVATPNYVPVVSQRVPQQARDGDYCRGRVAPSSAFCR